MHYTGLTYRPPYEADSVLLQVTAGCSHNACTFCTMYRKTQFSVSPIEEVEADLAEVARVRPDAERVFLVNGDAFCLDTDRLLRIADLIHAYLPRVRRITGYARITNIESKTDDELRLLAAAGYGDLNIGVESALDDVLAFMNKGYTTDVARRQLKRLNECGLSFSINIMDASAGPERIAEHAKANAELANEVQPTLIFVSPLHIDPGSDLEHIAEAGGFEECTLGQYIDEEILFLEGLEQRDCVFFGLHVSNPIPVAGWLPRDKETLLYELKRGKARLSQRVLDSHPSKGAEGALR